jgi:hypothetical protein
MEDKTNIKIFLLCPIPENQKPITEYKILKDNVVHNWFFRKFHKTKFEKWLPFFLCYLIFFSLNFSVTNNLSFFIFHIFVLTNNIFAFIFLILFVRWKQLFNRFYEAESYYEESSWFDGTLWKKPWFILKTDRLIAKKKIQLILNQLNIFLILNIILNFLNFIVDCFNK